jgi:hypothetical protein
VVSNAVRAELLFVRRVQQRSSVPGSVPVVGTQADGGWDVYAVRYSDDTMMHMSQGGGVWNPVGVSNWTPSNGAPAVGRRKDGKMVVLAGDVSQNIWIADK